MEHYRVPAGLAAPPARSAPRSVHSPSSMCNSPGGAAPLRRPLCIETAGSSGTGHSPGQPGPAPFSRDNGGIALPELSGLWASLPRGSPGHRHRFPGHPRGNAGTPLRQGVRAMGTAPPGLSGVQAPLPQGSAGHGHRSASGSGVWASLSRGCPGYGHRLPGALRGMGTAPPG